MKTENIKNEEFINAAETMRKALEETPMFLNPENGKVEMIKFPTVEITQSRYEQLVACETELKLLKTALTVINSYDFSGVKKIFGIEKKGEE